ncbi:MAG: BatA domain-containing protein [Planctomycetales bacterium]|nr:BatA domain-containing protein [Planctomycetales bacterium]
MTFLQPWLLWSLPLALIPLVIHLINLRRHRTVEWGAMQFLLQATRHNRGKTRLRHFLIMLARILGVAGLLFAISRPMSGRWFSWFGDQPDTIILLLDRSASMAQQDMQTNESKRSLAVEQIATALERTGEPPNLVLIESTRNTPQTLQSAASLREIPETRATDADANLPAMMQSALDYIVSNQAGRTDIWICSDTQSGDWNSEGGQWAAIRAGFQELKQPVQFHLLAYSQSAADNASIRISELRREAGSDTDRLVMDIQIRRSQAEGSVKLPVGIVVDGARTVIDVEMQGESFALDDQFVPIDKQKEFGWGKVELPPDVNPRDSVFYFTYGNDILKRTVVVSDQPGSAWALKLAAAPPVEKSTAEATIIRPDEVGSIEWNETSLIMWQAALPFAETAKKLEEFVNSGGQIVFFPPQDDSTESFQGVKWGDWEKLNLGPDEQAVKDWRDDSGLLAHADNGSPLPVNRIVVNDFRKLAGSGQVLAHLQTGDALLQRIPTDHGGVYFCATLPQQPFSNLAQAGIAYFVMVQRALADGAERLLESQFGLIGDQLVDEDAPAWQRIDGWEEGTLSSEQRFIAGIYQEGDRLLARNRPPAEDNPGTLTSSELERLFGGLNYRIVQDQVEGASSLVSEIWQAFVLLLLIALIVEAALCLPDVRTKKVVTP